MNKNKEGIIIINLVL